MTPTALPQKLAWLPAALPRSADRRLVLLMCAALLALLVWAALAPIDRIVRAQGRIVAAGRAQVVQHLEGGIVSEILVREGQTVVAGQTVIRLSAVLANSSVEQSQSRMQSLSAQQARLTAEAQGSGGITFSADVPQDVQTLESRAFQERLLRLSSEQSVLRQQVMQRQAELAEARARAQSLAAELALARQQASLMEGLLAKGAASQIELLDAQGRRERLNTQYADVFNAIPRLQSAIGETTARLNEATARFRAEARAELNQVSADLARIKAGAGGDTDRLSRTEVKAPVAGYVNRLHFNTIGGVIKPGDPLLEITPNQGPLAVEARVRPDDRAALRPGLPTRIMIGAYDYTVYGALQGHVVEVSADTLPDESGQRYYRVVVQTQAAQGRLRNEVILPGMTAHADVVLGQRSVLSYLLSPLLRFGSQAMREPR